MPWFLVLLGGTWFLVIGASLVLLFFMAVALLGEFEDRNAREEWMRITSLTALLSVAFILGVIF